MIQIGKNAILYRGRYIRLMWSKVFGREYQIQWAYGGREIKYFNGSLKELMEQISETDKFFGKWRFLI